MSGARLGAQQKTQRQEDATYRDKKPIATVTVLVRPERHLRRRHVECTTLRHCEALQFDIT